MRIPTQQATTAIAAIALAFSSSRLGAQQDREPVPRASSGNSLKLATLDVASAKPASLTKEAGWSNIPDYLAEAKIFSDTPTGRELDATVKTDGIVLIAASWTYDGNPSGGWAPTRTTREQLVEQGWAALDDIVLKEKDKHTIFFRQFKAGDKIKLHTRKYNQPYVVALEPKQLPVVSGRIVEAMARIAARPAPTSRPMPADTGREAAPPKPVAVAVTKDITVADVTTATLVDEKEWSPFPDYLRGAALLKPARGNVLDLSASADVLVVVAASWAYDGNPSGNWFEGRSTLQKLIADGWEPVGTVVQKDKGEHTLLRRKLKAGDHFKFHTRKHNPPVVIVPSADQLQAVAALPPMTLPSNDLAGIRPAPPSKSTLTGKGVVLRTHEPDVEDRFAVRGILLREVIRQAVLITARDHFGIPTRDEALRERSAGGDQIGPKPIDVVVHMQRGGVTSVTLFHFRGDKPEILWDKQFTLAGDDIVLAMTVEAERLSREEFPTALGKAGFDGRENPIVENGSTPQTLAPLIIELHPIPQLAAARALHRSLRKQGESPERLADLARVYANLSVLTEHLWYPAHKTFKARAMLYAQRGVQRWPDSPVSLSGRAYARALVGLHQAALDDLAAAKAHADADRALAPRREILQLVEAFCRFDSPPVAESDISPASRPLARMLRFLAAERFAGTTEIVRVAEQFLEVVPDSDRAIDAIYETDRLGTEGYAATLGRERTPQGLYRRLLLLDELPRKVSSLASQAGADGAGAEYARRVELVRALRTDGELGADTDEPSWQTLATWIEEVSFMQSARQMQYLAYSLSVPLDQTRRELEPLVVDHPYVDFIASLCDDRDQRHIRLDKFAAVVRSEDASMNEDFCWSWLKGHNVPRGEKLSALAHGHQDLIYRDLLLTTRNLREFVWATYAEHLRRVSPYSPLTIATTIEFDWTFASEHAGDWEKKYENSPQVQGALGRQLLKQKKYEDAIRCLKKQAALVPEFESYAPLARAWLEQNKEREWLATWDEFLRQEDYGLGHARARVIVAEYFMERGQWDRALPYAEEASASGAQWALQCMVDCLTGLKRWPEAEQHAQASAERYPPTSPTWYFWCRQTGYGSVALARDSVRRIMADPRQGINLAYKCVFLTLDGEKQQALGLYRSSLEKQPSPSFGWHAALLADELKQPDVRDQSLKMVVQSARQFDRPKLGELAVLAQEALTAEERQDDRSKFAALHERVSEIVKATDDPREKCVVSFLAGKLLLLHGHKTGERLIQQAADSPFTSPVSALASVELRAIQPTKNTR